MKAFINSNKTSYACNLIEGIHVMKVIEACEKSNRNKAEICLD